MRSRSAASAATLLLSFIAATVQAEQAFDLDQGTKVLAPISYNGLSVFPIVKTPKDGAKTAKENYLTLADGLKKKVVRVTEMGNGGSVNEVTVSNKSSRPLLLLGGEMILGGQQDRIMGQDMVISAGNTRTVHVYCVEHGRWSGGQHFTGSGGMAEGRIRASAKFKADQGAVWNEVAQRNASLNAQNATGTYREIAVGPEGDKAVKPYRDHVSDALDKLPDAKDIVGFATAIGDRIVSVDVFDSPALFDSYKAGLLQSAFVSAASTPAVAVPVAAIPPKAVGDFMQQAEAAPAASVSEQDQSVTTISAAKGVARSELKSKDGKKEKAIYRSYQQQ